MYCIEHCTCIWKQRVTFFRKITNCSNQIRARVMLLSYENLYNRQGSKRRAQKAEYRAQIWRACRSVDASWQLPKSDVQCLPTKTRSVRSGVSTSARSAATLGARRLQEETVAAEKSAAPAAQPQQTRAAVTRAARDTWRPPYEYCTSTFGDTESTA